MKTRILNAVAMMTISSSLAFKAHAQDQKPDVQTQQSGDTYNFYFQKAPGSNDVNQGRGAQVVEPQESEDDVPPTKNAVTYRDEEPRETYSKADFQIGVLTGVGDGAGSSGALVGIQYNPTIYLGLQAQLLALRGTVYSQENAFGSYGPHESSVATAEWGASIAASLAPGVIGSREKQFRIGVLLGAAYLQGTQVETIESFGPFDSGSSSVKQTNIGFIGFAGLDSTFYFSRKFGANAYAKLATSPEFHQAGVNFIWRL